MLWVKAALAALDGSGFRRTPSLLTVKSYLYVCTFRSNRRRLFSARVLVLKKHLAKIQERSSWRTFVAAEKDFRPPDPISMNGGSSELDADGHGWMGYKLLYFFTFFGPNCGGTYFFSAGRRLGYALLQWGFSMAGK